MQIIRTSTEYYPKALLWAMLQFCFLKPLPTCALLVPAIPYFVSILDKNDSRSNVITEVCQVLSHLIDVSNSFKEAVLSYGGKPKQ